MNEWYLVYNGTQVGPMTLEQLGNYPLTPETMVWHTGAPEWQKAFHYPEVMELIGKSSNPQGNMPPQYNQYGAPVSHEAKSNVVFGVLAILLGTLGIQYFYVNKATAGIITILLSLLTCGLWGIITLIQGIIVLMMQPAVFEQKFVNTQNTFPLF